MMYYIYTGVYNSHKGHGPNDDHIDGNINVIILMIMMMIY